MHSVESVIKGAACGTRNKLNDWIKEGFTVKVTNEVNNDLKVINVNIMFNNKIVYSTNFTITEDEDDDDLIYVTHDDFCEEIGDWNNNSEDYKFGEAEDSIMDYLLERFFKNKPLQTMMNDWLEKHTNGED